MDNTQSWWPVVEALSRYLSMGIDASSIFDEHIHQALMAEGYTAAQIDRALEWLEDAAMSCEITDILSLSQPVSGATRIPTSLEEKYIPVRIQRHIEKATETGIFSHEFSEKLRESLLSMETKDWSEADQMQFFIEVLQSTLPHHNIDALKKFFQGKNTAFYC